MKSINKLAVVALLALSSASLASAQTIIHVTGSTAYRVADVTAECAALGAGTKAVSFASNTGTAASSASSLTGANYSIVYGPGTGSSETIYENYFNGSIAGDEALVDGVTTLNFPKASTYASSAVAVTQGNSTTAASIGTAGELLSNTSYDVSSPDIAFSDVSFSTADQVILNSTDHTTTQPAGSAIVGIVPFVFVVNGSSDVYSELSGLSMDPQKFTYTWSSGGSTLLSFFTGNNADEATTVYPMGRDVDSGTRATALAETGYGLAGSGIVTTSVAQYYPFASQAADTADQNTANANIANGFSATTGVIGADSSLSNPTIAVLDFVPQEQVDGYTMAAGDGGYYSGGNLAKGMSTQFASGTVNTVVMTYLGVSDAVSALTRTGTNTQAAKLMAYNGVTFNPTTNTAANSSLIYEGTYSFWGYEHEFYKSTASTAATALKTQLNSGIDELSSDGVTFGSMNVSRVNDGQNVQ
jgi:hypothetical protein